MSNSDAYRRGLTGRAMKNPFPTGCSEWKCWNLGKAARGRGVPGHKSRPHARVMKKNPALDRSKPAGPYYVLNAGKRVYHKTLAAAQRMAQDIADRLAKPVTVHQAKRPTKTARARLR